MSERIPFSSSEMEIIGSHITTTEPVHTEPIPMRNSPITPKENYKRAVSRKGSALWFPMVSDTLSVES